MKNSKFIQAIIQMQYVSRWNEHSPRFKDSAASHSFRCASIAILIGIIEDRIFANPVDKLRLVARALLHDMNETVTGSIKHVTKKDILVAAHIRELEQEVSEGIVAYLSKSLQPHFHDFIVHAEDDSYIGRLVKEIDSFDAMLFCMREYKLDSNPYFKTQYEKLQNSLSQCACPSIKWLLSALGSDKGVSQFLHHILDLDRIERWGGSFNLIPDNDATHSFRVAALSLFNGMLEAYRFGVNDINLYRLLGKSIMHDIVEGISGDVASPIKKSSAQIRAAFEKYEQEVSRGIVMQLPPIFHDEIIDFMVHAKDDTYEGTLVDISDKLDALIKSNLEMRNNPHYADIYYQQLVNIQHRHENSSTIFFLAYILHDLTYANYVR